MCVSVGTDVGIVVSFEFGAIWCRFGAGLVPVWCQFGCSLSVGIGVRVSESIT